MFSDCFYPATSDVSTSVKKLKNELAKKGHEVYVVTGSMNFDMPSCRASRFKYNQSNGFSQTDSLL